MTCSMCFTTWLKKAKVKIKQPEVHLEITFVNWLFWWEGASGSHRFLIR